jgi:hypothetical protein
MVPRGNIYFRLTKTSCRWLRKHTAKQVEEIQAAS